MDLISVWWLVGAFAVGLYMGILGMALMYMSADAEKWSKNINSGLSGLGPLERTTLSP